MADDTTRLKSSFELAMERLRQKDAEAGVTIRTPTDAEKAQIAEVRNLYEAKIAEAQVMHLSRLQNMPDPAGREPWNPDTMTHRYRQYARRVGITAR